MRGLRLFVRPVEPQDAHSVAAFLDQHREASAPQPSITAPSAGLPACALLGKLLGDIVAVAELVVRNEGVEIQRIIVAAELRKKRIGKVMLREVEDLARKLDRSTLLVDEPGAAAGFFERAGFEREGMRWIKRL